MPGLQDYLVAQANTAAPANQWTLNLPYAPQGQAVADPSQNTWIGGGINAGIREMRGMGGAAIEALGKATGIQGLEQWGAEAARNNMQRAQEVGRPDLEIAPWKEGGASTVPWLVYQSAKALPTLAAMIGVGAATGGSGLVPGAAARLGVMAPTWLGGGGAAGVAALQAGGVAGQAALAAGQKLAGNVIGATLAGYLPAAGGAYTAAKEAAHNQGREASTGEALGALGAGLPSAAIGAVQPQILRDIFGKPLGEAASQGVIGVARRLADDGIKGGLSQVPIAAAQEMINTQFRPDLDMGQKAHQVVDAAITGGVLGGVMGVGAGGLRELKGRRPAQVTNQDLSGTIDATLNGQGELNLEGGSGTAPPRVAPATEAPPRPFQQLTERQLEQRLENAGKGATLGVPEDVALFNQLQIERQLRQPELPLGEGYSDNLTAPIPTRYDLTPNAPPPPAPPPVGTQGGLDLRGGSGLPPLRALDVPPRGTQGVLPLDMRAPPTSATPTIADAAQLDMFARPRPPAAEPAPGQPSTIFDPRQRELMPVVQELPLGDQPARAPSQGDAEARPLRRVARADLDGTVLKLTDIENTRPLTAEERAQRQLAYGELQARAAEQRGPGQRELPLQGGEMFPGVTLADYYGEPAERARPQPQGLTWKDHLQRQTGANRLPKEVLDAPDLPAALELLDQAAARAKTGNSPALKAAEEFGLDGSIDAKLAAATVKVQNEELQLQQWRGEAAPDPLNLQRARSELYELQQRKAAIDEMERRRAGGDNAVPVAGPEGLDVRQPAEAGSGVAEGNTQGREAPSAQGTQRRATSGETQTHDIWGSKLAWPEAVPDHQAHTPEATKAAQALAREVQPLSMDRLSAEMLRRGQGPEDVTANPTWAAELDASLEAARNNPDSLVKASLRRLDAAVRNGDAEQMRQHLSRLIELGAVADNALTDHLRGGIEGTVYTAHQEQRAYNTYRRWLEGYLRVAAVALDPKLQTGPWDASLDGLKRSLADTVNAPKSDVSVTPEMKLAAEQVQDYLRRREAVNENRTTANWLGEGQDGNWTAFSKVPEPTDTPVFAAPQTEGAVPLGDAPFKAVLARMSKLLGASADRLRVVDTADQLPEKVKQQAEAQGTPLSEIRGSYSDGIGWLVRDRIRSEADVQEVVAHEMFGHAGAKAAFNDRFDRFSQLFDKAGGLEGVMRIARKFDAADQLQAYVPEGRTALDKARFFDEMLAQAAGKSEGTLRQTALAWMGKVKQSMIGMLENLGLTALARRMDTFTSLDTAVMLRNMRKAVQAGFEVPADHEAAFSRVDASVPEANENMKETVQKGALGILNTIQNRAADIAVPIRRATEMLTLSPHKLAEVYRKGFSVDANGRTPLDRWNWSRQLQSADRVNQSRMYEAPLAALQELPAKKQQLLSEMLETASMNGFVPGTGWDQHPQLHKLPNAEALKQSLIATNEQYQRVVRDQQLKPVYENLVGANKAQMYSRMLGMLRNVMQLDPAIPHTDMPSFRADPMEVFRQQNTVHGNMTEVANYFKTALDATLADARTHADTLRGRLDGLSGVERRALETDIAPLDAFLRNIDRSMAQIGDVPYVHLGRSGDFFVGAKMRVGANGKGVDQQSLQAIKTEAMKRGYDNVRIVMGADSPNLFVRMDTASQAENFRDFLRDMQRQGHIQPDRIIAGAGLDSDVSNHLSRMVPKLTEQLLSRIKESPAFKLADGASSEDVQRVTQMRNLMESQIRDAVVDMLPAESIGRFMARRAGVQGFSADFVRNQAKRLRAGVNAFTSLYHAADQATALQNAYSDVRGAETTGTAPINDLADMKAAYSEFIRRQNEPVATGGSKWADIARSATHSFLTAASPAYAMVQATQLAVTGLPELGKRFGYMPAAKAMAEVTTPALNILRTAIQEGMKSRGVHGAADMVITRGVLEKAGVPRDMQNYLIRMIGQGALELGSQSRELGMLADADVPGTARRVAQYANVMGFAAEGATRLITAMATYKLANGRPDLDGVAHSVMDNAMFNFGPTNTSRLLDPHNGPFGRATGLAAVFLRFQSMLIEKLYREVHTAIAGNTPQAKAESRRFLAGHLAAMTVLGGTMALPMVSVLARAADKLVDLTSDNGAAPYDVKSAWRGWLADIFGKDMGEIAARGLPRALGLDMSNRIGEQDIIPFSRFLTDRRKAEDTIQDLALRVGGAGVAQGINIFEGLNDIFNHGDVQQGMIKILPAALRNPLTAYRQGSMGYVDEKNAPLPLSSSARSIAIQALGFTPSELAEYRDNREAMLVRKTDLETNAGLIRKHLATAMEQGDPGEVRAQIQRLTNHDRLNPAYAIGPSLAAALAARRQAPLVAQATGMPLGGNIKDLGSWSLGSGYNWRQ